MFEEILRTVAAEFTDVSAPQAVQLAVRLIVAAIAGGVLGFQREKSGKAAGLRTHILVAVGTAAFVAIPQQAGIGPEGVSRVLQGLTAGIGFLGAGCILKRDDESQVKGLTTAAGIWLTAGVGVAAGLGRELSAILLGAFGWFTLSILARFEERIGVRTNGQPPAKDTIQV